MILISNSKCQTWLPPSEELHILCSSNPSYAAFCERTLICWLGEELWRSFGNWMSFFSDLLWIAVGTPGISHDQKNEFQDSKLEVGVDEFTRQYTLRHREILKYFLWKNDIYIVTIIISTGFWLHLLYLMINKTLRHNNYLRWGIPKSTVNCLNIKDTLQKAENIFIHKYDKVKRISYEDMRLPLLHFLVIFCTFLGLGVNHRELGGSCLVADWSTRIPR